ncbi:MAG: tyrosine-type recombinase/integrase [Deltaproteobacteria bacterium]|nr:tyrosine-type recombinase/integrase [Deltaproteobacteria bacterium]
MAEGGLIVPEQAQIERAERGPRSPALVYLARLGSPASRLTMAGCLDRIARTLQPGSDSQSFPWHELTYEHTQAIRSWLAERFAPTTAGKYLAALRGVLKEAWRLELMSAEDYRRACDLEPVRGHREPPGRMLTAGELAAVFTSCKADSSPAGARDAALLAFIFGAGLRRSEVTGLELRHYNRETGEIHVEHGKGNKDRLAGVAGGGKRAVDAWLEIRGLQDGPILYPVVKGGRIAQPASRSFSSTTAGAPSYRTSGSTAADAKPSSSRATPASTPPRSTTAAGRMPR